MADMQKHPPLHYTTGEYSEDTQRIMRTLQTEFKGKTREEIERAIDQARKPGVPDQTYDHVLEESRVLLGAGSRG